MKYILFENKNGKYERVAYVKNAEEAFKIIGNKDRINFFLLCDGIGGNNYLKDFEVEKCSQ